MSIGIGDSHDAQALGWTDHEEACWNTVSDNCIPARITSRYVSSWRVMVPDGFRETAVKAAGAFHYLCAGPDDYPVVGDWVALSPDGGMIQRRIPRRTTITRQESGRAARAQILAANVDTVFLVFGLDGGRNFSIGLLERFLTVVAAGGVEPVVVLNKADCTSTEHIESVKSQVRSVRADIVIRITSVPDGRGLEELRNLIPVGTTTCCLGRSGVGKSSITNSLLRKQHIRTAEVNRIRHRGRHTTTNSQLLMLPGGGLLIDTPGLRELQLWGEEDSLHESFTDILELAAECRFRDCRHQGEPGCAVQKALAEGILPHQRLEHYLEQRDELAEAELRRRMSAAAYEKQRWKKIRRR